MADPQPIQLSIPQVERQMLAWVLRDRDLLRRYRGRLAASEFSDLAYRWIWTVAHSLEAAGEDVNPAAITAKVEGQPVAKKVTLELLQEIIAETPFEASPETCVKLLSEKGLRRRLNAASTKLAQLSLDPDKPIDQIESESRELLREALATRQRLDKLKDPATRAQAALDRYERQVAGDTAGIIPFGWPQLDNLFGGARSGQYIIVAAASGMGKTAFMHSWAQRAGMLGKKILYVSCEMEEGDLTDREVSRWGNIPLSTIRRKLATEGIGDRLFESVAAVASGNVWVWDEEPITPSLIESVADQMMSEVGLDIVFIDYLQIVTPDRERGDRRAEIEEISGRFRLLARTMKIPVVTGSQLSRAYMARADKAPLLEDLRESGKIAHDAHIVIGLFRPGALRSENAPEDSIIEFHALKNRQDGPVGEKRALSWDGPLTDMYDPREIRLYQQLAGVTSSAQDSYWWDKQ